VQDFPAFPSENGRRQQWICAPRYIYTYSIGSELIKCKLFVVFFLVPNCVKCEWHEAERWTSRQRS